MRKPYTLLVERHDSHRAEEVVEIRLTSQGVAGVVHPFIEFRQRDYRQADALGLELAQPLDDLRLAVQVVNHPIGVHQVVQAHSSGFGRVEISRSV